MLLRRWLTVGTFLSRSSTGSIPSFAASSSIICSSAHAPCGKPGARKARALPALMKTSVSSVRTFGQRYRSLTR